MNAYFSNHRITQESEFIDYLITEKRGNESEVIIFREVLEIDHEIFMNTINKNIRLKKILLVNIFYIDMG